MAARFIPDHQFSPIFTNFHRDEPEEREDSFPAVLSSALLHVVHALHGLFCV
jgi:hypothetical protein